MGPFAVFSLSAALAGSAAAQLPPVAQQGVVPATTGEPAATAQPVATTVQAAAPPEAKSPDAAPVSPTPSGDTASRTEQPEPAAAQEGGAPAAAKDQAKPAEHGCDDKETDQGRCGKKPAPEDDVCVGQGYHPFDQTYVLLGPNLQFANDSRAVFQNAVLEVELSVVPSKLISNQLLWLGAWASFGSHGGRYAAWRRTGAGLEFGYRFLAADVGYVFDESIAAQPHGVRFRLGAALSMELFTDAKYRRSCCHEAGKSDTVCECDRVAAGLSVFPYWAIEAYPTKGDDPMDGMFGISLKLALGL